MDEETEKAIAEIFRIKGQLEASGLRPFEEIPLRERLKSLENALPVEILRDIREGKFRPPPPKPEVEACDVLVLTANPTDTTELALEAESRGIQEECSAGTRPLVVLPRFAGVDVFGRWVLRYRPRFVHFSGHGSADGELWLEQDDGTGAKVNAESIAALMRQQNWRLEAVFLNACWTERAAAPFLDLADWVVGMTDRVGDNVATKFAKGFYRGLSHGLGVRQSFEWANAELELERLSGEVVKLIRGNRPFTAEEGPAPFPLIADIGRRGAGRTSIEIFRGGDAAFPGVEDKPKAAEGKAYPVWFGTNRKPIDPGDFSKGFGSEREEGEKVWHGAVTVTIPKAHKVGGVGSKWWKRIFTGDDRLKVVWNTLRRLEIAAFWESVNRAVREHIADGEDDPMAMVYVHGYNVSFEDAAIRAAQIGCDLNLPGPMAFFSWPSKGRLDGYFADSNTVLACVPQLVAFLKGFVAELDEAVKKVHVLAHSMGNRLVLDAVNELNQEFGRKVFNQAILAAADVDRDVFKQRAGAFREIAERTTLYISNSDNALKASEIVNAFPRAGYYKPETVVDGIDTIRANRVSQGWLGHGYYAEAKELLSDLVQLIHHNAPPNKRAMVREVEDEGNDSGLKWELID